MLNLLKLRGSIWIAFDRWPVNDEVHYLYCTQKFIRQHFFKSKHLNTNQLEFKGYCPNLIIGNLEPKRKENNIVKSIRRILDIGAARLLYQHNYFFVFKDFIFFVIQREVLKIGFWNSARVIVSQSMLVSERTLRNPSNNADIDLLYYGWTRFLNTGLLVVFAAM